MENIPLHEKIMSGMCRLCLTSDGALIDMFSFSSELESKISDAVTKCTSVHVEKHSELPTTICESCYMQLIKTQNFQIQALKSDKTLQVYLQRLHDDNKQSILRSSVIFPDIDNSSLIVNNAADQTKEDNSTTSEEIKPNVKDPERGCEKPEMNIIENKIFAADSRSHTKWNVHSSNKDSVFNPNLIVKAEPIIGDKDLFDDDTEILNDYAVSQKHIKPEIEVSSDKTIMSYQCDVCNKYFSNADILRKHQRSHTGEEPYHCDLCNTSMIDLNNFKEHLRVHTEEKPYQCDVCNKCFRIAGSLTKHQRVHTGEKPYQCDVCAKCFSNSANLRRHQRVHTGEKPYQCDVCNKCFSFSSAFKSHHRIHTGEKPYKCNVCSKCFTSSSFLIVHKRTHTGEKPYQCDVCNKCFSISTTLKIHQRVHTGEKPYQCDICNKGFSQLCALNNHKRKHSSDV